MPNNQNILQKIKAVVKEVEPDATLILYGSYARGTQTERSDVDVLILINQEKVTWLDEKRIAYPLYDIEFDAGVIISPLIFSKQVWETKHKITPFYKNIEREGKPL